MAKSKNSSLNLPGINVAIIMDGNGRWAKKNALNVTSGHEKGVDVVRKIVESAAKAKLESLSLYAFSTENWSRPKKRNFRNKETYYQSNRFSITGINPARSKIKFFGDYSSFGETVLMQYWMLRDQLHLKILSLN